MCIHAFLSIQKDCFAGNLTWLKYLHTQITKYVPTPAHTTLSPGLMDFLLGNVVETALRESKNMVAAHRRLLLLSYFRQVCCFCGLVSF